MAQRNVCAVCCNRLRNFWSSRLNFANCIERLQVHNQCLSCQMTAKCCGTRMLKQLSTRMLCVKQHRVIRCSAYLNKCIVVHSLLPFMVSLIITVQKSSTVGHFKRSLSTAEILAKTQQAPIGFSISLLTHLNICQP